MLEVRDLSIAIGSTPVLQNISFSIRSSQRVALVGASGVGKSLLAKTLIGMPPVGVQFTGEILFQNNALLKLSKKEWKVLRGRKIALLPQDSLSALDPCFSVGSQIAEVFRYVRGFKRTFALQQAKELLKDVGFSDEKVFKNFPHELSGGMRQRVLVALSLAAQPDLLIADEATTALDPQSSREIVSLIHQLSEKHSFGLLWITHDRACAAQLCTHTYRLSPSKCVEVAQ